MRWSSVDGAGRLAHSVGLSRVVANIHHRRPFVRATVTHGVFQENAPTFARTVDSIGEKHGFISPSDYTEFLSSDCASQHPAKGGVLLTFDDGLLSSYEFIVNELTPRGIRSIMFVPTAVLTMPPDRQLSFAIATRWRSNRNLREEQYLTIGVREVERLAREGHMVMPHSHTHARLSALEDEDDLRAEIEAPRNILEQVTNCVTDMFAVPYGDRAALSLKSYWWIRSTYRYCFTAIGGRSMPSSNRLLLPRENLDQTFDSKLVGAKLTGTFDAYNALRARSLQHRLKAR